MAASFLTLALACGDDSTTPVDGGAGDALGDVGIQTDGDTSDAPQMDGGPGVCTDGTYDNDADPTTPCVEWTQCAEGEYVSEPGSDTADQTCAGCASGTFSEGANATECSPWTTCEAGTFVDTEPSATSDRSCSPCGDGTTTTGDNQSMCVEHGACEPGTVQTAPGTSTMLPTCEPCVAGEYCPGGEMPRVACGDGTWDNDVDSSTACVDLTVCAPGSFVGVEGNATTDRTCDVCADGSFSAEQNALSCDPWTECVAGEFAEGGTTSTDRSCSPCAAGFFSLDTNATSCSPFTACTAGQFISVPGTATTDQSCGGCASGTFSTTNNASACTAFETCVAGTFVATAGTAMSDRVCEACAPGTFTSGNNQSTCVDVGSCAPGTIQTAPATDTMAPVCEACAAGEYCAGNEAPRVACAAGTWDDDANPATACEAHTECSAGSFVTSNGSATTNRSCSACAAGTYSTGANAASCDAWTTCVAGQSASGGSATTNRSCSPCAAGTYSTTNNASSCTAWTTCSSSQYVSALGSSTTNVSCSVCALPSASQYVSSVCDHGSATDVGSNTGFSTCSSPLAGTFTASACVQGNANTLGTNTVTTSCAAPVAGQYTSAVCVRGTSSMRGTDTTVSSCDSPTSGNYVSAVCTPGSAVALGSNTATTACAAPPAGRYVSQVCVGGNPSTLGTNTQTTACTTETSNPNNYISTACVSGNASTLGANALFSDCTDVANCSVDETCTSATSSQCTTCTAPFVLTDNTPPNADLCAPGRVRLSATDHDPDIRIRWDGLGADLDSGFGGARSDTGIAPGSGVFYVEGRRTNTVYTAFGIAVASGLLDLNNVTCGATDQSFGINVTGGISYAGGWAGGFDEPSNEYYGLVADYRGATPTIYLILEDVNWSAGGVIEPIVRLVQPMPEVTTDLFFMLCGSRAVVGAEMEVNPGNDTTNFPFYYDVDSLLRAAGHTDVADNLVMGWGSTNAPPANDAPVVTTSADVTVSLGASATVTASANDTEDGGLNPMIQWDLETSPYYAERMTGAGTSFTFTPTDIGVHPVRAWVVDSAGQVGESTINVTVSGSLPQYDPVELTPDALAPGTGVVLRADALAGRWTGWGKYGIRANQGIYGQFWYFEMTRLVAPVNMGGGVVVNFGNLDPYDWANVPQSMSVNVLGGTWHNLVPRVNLPGPSTDYTTYGFAVDYRGARPTVYVIANDAVVDTIVMDDVTTPLYPMLYANPTGLTVAGEFDQSINFGTTPFANDANAALTAEGVDLTGFGLGWGDANLP